MTPTPSPSPTPGPTPTPSPTPTPTPGPTPTPSPTPTPTTTSYTGSAVGVAIGGTSILGPSGSGTLVDVNVAPPAAGQSTSGLAVDVLSGDGKAIAVTLPTTPQATQAALAPVGAIAGALLGPQVGSIVNSVTDGLSPTVAVVTSTVSQVTNPLLGTVDGVLAPVLGQGGLLAPVSGQLGGLVDGLTGALPGGGSGPAPTYTGPLVGLDLGNNALTGPSTSGTLIGANVLSEDPGLVSGTLLTADVLSADKVVDVTLPTTADGVAQGLRRWATSPVRCWASRSSAGSRN
ncbi:hypothetical protein ACFSLT_16935 [Novosphingobium resinovorum]